MPVSKYRVIQWGSGYTGTYALQHVLSSPRLELVGLKCFRPENQGRDAGEIAGLANPIGIKAELDTARLLELDADCVLFMPRDALADPSIPGSPSEEWVPDLVAILESGKDVVSSICSCTHWRHLANGAALRDRLNAACRRGNSTLFFTGFDPGFTSDALAIALTSVVREIREIRTWEILDYSQYTVESTMRALGLGLPPQEMGGFAAANIRATWGGAVFLLAEALDVEVEDMRVETEAYVSPRSFVTGGGVAIAAGTVGGYRFSVAGYVKGKPLLSINHVTRMAPDMAPDWPTLGHDGGYKVEIDAFPPVYGSFPLGLPGGTGSSFNDALVTTAARCVNSIDAVVRAEPGYRTLFDLRPIGGSFAISR